MTPDAAAIDSERHDDSAELKQAHGHIANSLIWSLTHPEAQRAGEDGDEEEEKAAAAAAKEDEDEDGDEEVDTDKALRATLF